ncbi:hypothetical protein [Caudoviricetes sp.]|nr:hypothetical protein [Caudoviricetes sp.]
MLELSVDRNGTVHNYTSTELGQFLADQAGLQFIGTSPDGSGAIVSDGQGQSWTAPLQDVAQASGLKVLAAKPMNVNEDAISTTDRMGFRHAIENLDDPDQIKTYLTFKAKKMGIENPQILGSGADWYMFSPQSGWMAMTNNKGFDLSDVVGVGNDVVKMGAPIAGGIIGGVAGVGAGSAALGAAGAAAGTVASEAAMRGLAAFDEDYRQSQDLSKAMQKTAINAGVNAIGGALPGAVSVGARAAANVPILGKTLGAADKLMNLSPASSTLRTVGGGAQLAGGAAELGGKALQTMPGKIAFEALDPTGISLAARGAEALGTAPSLLIPKNITSPLGKLGQKLTSEEAWIKMPKVGQKLQDIAKWGENVSSRPRINQDAIDAFGMRSDVLRKAEQMVKDKGLPLTSENRKAMVEQLKQQYINEPTAAGTIANLRQRAVDREILERAGKLAPERQAEFISRAQPVAQAQGAKWQKALQPLEKMQAVGRGIGKGLDVAEETLAGGLRYGGQGLGFAGRNMRRLGTATQPMEKYGWTSFAGGRVNPYNESWDPRDNLDRY